MRKILAFITAALFFAGAFGWVNNIITLATANNNEATGTLILRGVGILMAPLGAIMGYL